MTTVVDICNEALAEVRADPIVNITDNNPRAIACKRFYDRDRKYVLRSHPWNFAIKRSPAIVAEATAPEFGFTNYHAFPTDFLRLLTVHHTDVVGIGEDQSTLTPEMYAVEGQMIASNEAEIYLRYIYDLEDTAIFDNMFNTCFSYKLASSIGYQVTGSTTLKSEMFKLHKLALREAKGIDGQERPPVVVRRSPLARARGGRYGRCNPTINGC